MVAWSRTLLLHQALYSIGLTLLDYLAAMRAFVRSVDLGSFSRAAAEAGVKTSTISRYVSALEADLGAAILNRSTHGLKLTEIGRMFHEHATRIVIDVDDARELASSFNAVPQGCLRITAPAAFGRLHVMPHIPAFLASYPLVSIEVTLTDAHVDMIEAGCDLAVRIGTLPDSSLIARRLARHERVLCASPGYMASGTPVRNPEDVVTREALIFSLQPSPAWHFRHRETGEQRVVKVSGRVRVNDAEALLTCVLAGQGLAVLPTWLVFAHVTRGALVKPLPDWEVGIQPEFDRAIWALYPPKKIVSPKVRAFIAFFEEQFRKPVYWDVARLSDPRSE
jgi:DNA-binding transcriptional LysR family regulator